MATEEEDDIDGTWDVDHDEDDGDEDDESDDNHDVDNGGDEMMRMVMTLTMPHSNFKRNWKPTGQSVSNYILKLKGGGQQPRLGGGPGYNTKRLAREMSLPFSII